MQDILCFNLNLPSLAGFCQCCPVFWLHRLDCFSSFWSLFCFIVLVTSQDGLIECATPVSDTAVAEPPAPPKPQSPAQRRTAAKSKAKAAAKKKTKTGTKDAKAKDAKDAKAKDAKPASTSVRKTIAKAKANPKAKAHPKAKATASRKAKASPKAKAPRKGNDTWVKKKLHCVTLIQCLCHCCWSALFFSVVFWSASSTVYCLSPINCFRYTVLPGVLQRLLALHRRSVHLLALMRERSNLFEFLGISSSMSCWIPVWFIFAVLQSFQSFHLRWIIDCGPRDDPTVQKHLVSFGMA